MHDEITFPRSGLTSKAKAIASIAIIKGIKHFPPSHISICLGHSVTPMLNILGSIAFILCISALATKDLEVTLTTKKYRALVRGRLAGYSRRLAAYLTLWSFGVLITMLTSLVIVMAQAPLESSDYAPAAVTILWNVGMIVAMSVANIQIRLLRPTPLACIHPGFITLIYMAVFLFITYFDVLKEALV